MAKHSSQILELARKGAEHKYQELKEEIAALVKSFPHLRGRGTSSSGGRVARAEAPVRRRKRKPMSAAAKAAVSKRMKAYWATRRKAKK